MRGRRRADDVARALNIYDVRRDDLSVSVRGMDVDAKRGVCH